MKKFIKNYLLNIIFIIIALIFLVLLFFYGSEMLFFPFVAAFILSFVLKQKNIKNKEYYFFTRYKSIFTITILVIELILEILAINATGWNGMGYLAIMIIFAFGISFSLLLDIIIRLIYRLFFDLKFNFKSILKERLLEKIIIILLIAALIIIPCI